MGMLVGQLIKILKQFDQDREVMIHTLSGGEARKSLNETFRNLTLVELISEE